MTKEILAKDIMVPIEEYDKISSEDELCDVLSILKRNYENTKAGAGSFHKTLFVTDKSGKIIGKLSMYDLIRGLVPETAKKPNLKRHFTSKLSSRALEVSDEVGEFQEQFKWLHSSFLDLVKQEANKKVKDIMSPVYPSLKEKDTINHVIYRMFRENARQQLVVRDGNIVGVVNLMVIFSELLETVGPECYVNWQT
jgi:CBS domain containing-hemolysin-like protein